MATGKFCPKTGAYLRACRKAQGMTQLHLADKLGFKFYTIISQFEVGKLKLPARLYEEYAKALDVELFE
ncbi:MAG: helix-turn-helix transcriptional regulator, partial [Pseudoalteromonas distincta]